MSRTAAALAGFDGLGTGPVSGLPEIIADPGICAPATVHGPFGPTTLIYADDTASGRLLDRVERVMRDFVYPTYANTHSEASHCGRQTGRLREGARDFIRTALNAGPDHAVIFTGSGATAAFNKLVAGLGLAAPSDPTQRQRLIDTMPPAERPVVFVGPYEHHSNELPWRESIAEVVRIPLSASGQPCMETLAAQLERFSHRPLRLGSFSAASNVTGVKTDVRAVARLLHRFGAFAVFDYAAGAPYLAIDMQADAGAGGEAPDAVVMSPHKFPGGPGASGLLVARKALFRIGRPTAPGGGTVRFVTPTGHRYLDSIEAMEEAGTPNILGDIRAGLAFAIKSEIGQATLDACEARAIAALRELVRRYPQIEPMGPMDADRLAIFAFNIRIDGKYLHHALVVSMLSDIFGIQARGGCSCAGPYGHDLLGVDATQSAHIAAQIQDGYEIARPGWVRIGLSPVMDEAVIKRIFEALGVLATHGRRLARYYNLDPQGGGWHVQNAKTVELAFADLIKALPTSPHHPAPLPPVEWTTTMNRAHDLVRDADAFVPDSPALPAAIARDLHGQYWI